MNREIFPCSYCRKNSPKYDEIELFVHVRDKHNDVILRDAVYSSIQKMKDCKHNSKTATEHEGGCGETWWTYRCDTCGVMV